MDSCHLATFTVGLAIIISLIEPTDNCKIWQNGGIGYADMGLSVGCTMACFGPHGEQVHILHDTGVSDLHNRVLVMADRLPKNVDMALVLASYKPISWIIQLSPTTKITSYMLISKSPNSTVSVTTNGSIMVPNVLRASYPSIPYKLAGNALGIIRLAEKQYGLVTSYTESVNAMLWTLRVPQTQNPCISADWTVRTGPPYPHPTLPPIPTELVTETISTAGSLFIGVVLTIVLGFVPLFLCLCCLCFRARRNRYPQNGAGASFTIPSSPGVAGPPGVILSGAEPLPSELPPSYELSLRPALPPAPPDYEKVDDDLPPPYSVVAAAMKSEC